MSLLIDRVKDCLNKLGFGASPVPPAEPPALTIPEDGPGTNNPSSSRPSDESIRDVRVPTQSHRVEDVARYYDETHQTYLDGFGDVFQGLRPESTESLLDLILEAADIQDGMRVLDAGCGVCGPSIWFAQHRKVEIEALTISGVQFEESKRRVNSQGLQNQINVRLGDFHRLAELYEPASFDRVLFLETLCHAEDYRRVLEQAAQVLKPGGFLYIKDYFCTDHRSRPQLRARQMEDLRKMNEVYCLICSDLPGIVDVVSEVGYDIFYIRQPNYATSKVEWNRFQEIAGIDWNAYLGGLGGVCIQGVEIFASLPPWNRS